MMTKQEKGVLYRKLAAELRQSNDRLESSRSMRTAPAIPKARVESRYCFLTTEPRR